MALLVPFSHFKACTRGVMNRVVTCLIGEAIIVQDPGLRWKWMKEACFTNKTTLPTDEQMQQWRLHGQVTTQLHEYLAVIDDIEEAINAPGFGALPDTVNEEAALADRCKAADGATGACVVTEAGTHVSIGHAIRVVANIDKTGDIRGQLQRFAMADFHDRGVVKDKDAAQAGQDIRVGENVLAVFRTGVGEEFEYFVGQTRQLIASMGVKMKKKAVYTSVALRDDSAVMFCFPWAKVDVDTGCLQVADEPHEYYSVHAVREMSSLVFATGATSSPVDLIDAEDDDEAEPVSVTVGCSSIILKSVRVNWGVPELRDKHAVLQAIETAPVF